MAFFLPIGGLYNPYHLLGEPETAIESSWGSSVWKKNISQCSLDQQLLDLLLGQKNPGSSWHPGPSFDTKRLWFQKFWTPKAKLSIVRVFDQSCRSQNCYAKFDPWQISGSVVQPFMRLTIPSKRSPRLAQWKVKKLNRESLKYGLKISSPAW